MLENMLRSDEGGWESEGFEGRRNEVGRGYLRGENAI